MCVRAFICPLDRPAFRLFGHLFDPSDVLVGPHFLGRLNCTRYMISRYQCSHFTTSRPFSV
jgi:hypothetical protein